jgi:hypothetical protein
MSRTNKPRDYNSHSYQKGHHGWYKKEGNQRVRQEVKRQLKDVLFSDAYDEKRLPGGKKDDFFDRWWCC